MLGCLVLGSNPRLSGLRFGVFLGGPNARKGIVMLLGREPKRDDLMNGSVGRDGVLDSKPVGRSGRGEEERIVSLHWGCTRPRLLLVVLVLLLLLDGRARKGRRPNGVYC